MLSRGRRPRTHSIALVAFVLILVSNSLTRADVIEPDAPRRPISRVSPSSSFRRTENTSGWWVGTVGIAVALACCGWVSIASKKFLPKGSTNAPNLRVLGRTNLSPKHSVYLLDVGGRTLLIGTGPQGAPSLLGELDGDEAPLTLAATDRIDVRAGDGA